MNCHLSIIRCRDGTYSTGITNDLDDRIRHHNRGKGSSETERANMGIDLEQEGSAPSDSPARLILRQGFSRKAAFQTGTRLPALPLPWTFHFGWTHASGTAVKTATSLSPSVRTW